MNKKSGKIDFNDEQHLKSMLKQARKMMPSDKASIVQRIIAAISRNPKSIIPFVVVFVYVAICGIVVNVKWIVNLIMWLINLF